MENNGFNGKDIRARAALFLQEKGVYLVLMVCIAIVGAAIAAAYLPDAEAEEHSASEVSHSEDERLSEARLTPSPSPSPTPVPTPTPSAKPSQRPAQAMMSTLAPSSSPELTPKPQDEPLPSAPAARDRLDPPVKGGVIWQFAVDELVYSRTLEQWMTHNGVDISASRGEEVRAVEDGSVSELYEDDSMGVTVRISHKDGLETVYSNLRSDVAVSEGKRVSRGDVIGYVGDTAVSECGEPPHLHFEVHMDGRAVDPLEYVMVVE